jgi:predicted component of type VI protein secretion system
VKLQIQLQADGSPTAVQQFEIPFAGDTIVIGRGPESPLPLEGSKLSRNHAAFGVANGALTLTDLSSNGVWVNAQPIPKKIAVGLAGSEEIAIPGYRMRVRLVPPPSDPLPPPAPPAPTVVTKLPEFPPQQATVSPEPRAAITDAKFEPPGQDAPNNVATEPPWWKPSSMDRLVLLFIALAVALFAYYYTMQ